MLEYQNHERCYVQSDNICHQVRLKIWLGEGCCPTQKPPSRGVGFVKAKARHDKRTYPCRTSSFMWIQFGAVSGSLDTPRTYQARRCPLNPALKTQSESLEEEILAIILKLGHLILLQHRPSKAAVRLVLCVWISKRNSPLECQTPTRCRRRIALSVKYNLF